MLVVTNTMMVLCDADQDFSASRVAVGRCHGDYRFYPLPPENFFYLIVSEFEMKPRLQFNSGDINSVGSRIQRL